MKKKYINPTAQAIQLEINPLLQNVLSPGQESGQTGGDKPSKGFSIGNDGPEYDEEL
jgi:hypothetical protein